jgi:hypothetical protein
VRIEKVGRNCEIDKIEADEKVTSRCPAGFVNKSKSDGEFCDCSATNSTKLQMAVPETFGAIHFPSVIGNGVLNAEPRNIKVPNILKKFDPNFGSLRC